MSFFFLYKLQHIYDVKPESQLYQSLQTQFKLQEQFPDMYSHYWYIKPRHNPPGKAERCRNILHKRFCHKSEFDGPNIDHTTIITQYRSVLFTRTFRSQCHRLGLIPGQCLCVCNVKYFSSRENVDCDDALQTGVGCVECLGETHMLIKYFWNTTLS